MRRFSKIVFRIVFATVLGVCLSVLSGISGCKKGGQDNPVPTEIVPAATDPAGEETPGSVEDPTNEPTEEPTLVPTEEQTNIPKNQEWVLITVST